MTKESSIFVDLRHRRLLGRFGPYYLISPGALPVVPAPEVSGMAFGTALAFGTKYANETPEEITGAPAVRLVYLLGL
jgi:hypothetical protein